MKPNTQSSQLKVLVTGGAGFIGSALVRYLIKHTDYTVVNLDKLTYAGNLASLGEVSDNPRYAFEQLDICDAQQLKRIFQQYQPGLVFHLAAETHVDRSIESPTAFIQTNIVGTFTLLEQVRTYLADQPQKQANFRFIHVSTDEVYGDLGLSSKPSDQDKSASFQCDNLISSLFTECSPYKPSSPYSASKAASDHLIQAWWRTYQLPGILVHCSNNYGRYQYTEKLIPKTILNALNHQSISIYGNGQQIRDWLYVEDTVNALIIIAKKGQVSETYNVGGGSEKTNIDVVKTICKILDDLRPSAFKEGEGEISSYTQLITHVKDPPGHDLRYAIDATKIQRELGWTPQESFESGIRKAVQWYLDHQAWY